MTQRQWDRGTCWLHAGLAITVTFQLFVSLVMEVPQPGLRPQPFGLLAFRAHKAVGVAAIAVILVHWGWSLFRARGQAIGHLFPWGRAGSASIVADLRNVRVGRLPDGGPSGGVAGLVHGLGLLAATAMAILGGLMLLLPANGAGAALLPTVTQLHAQLSTFVWLFWVGHVAMVVVHETRGHRILAGIFKP